MLFSPKEKGQGLVEYMILVVIVAIIVSVILERLKPKIEAIFSSISNSMP